MVFRSERPPDPPVKHPSDRLTVSWEPLLRLLAVILVTSACVWINDVRLALLSFTVSLLIVLFTPRLNYKLLCFVVLITIISYMFGNLLFSPKSTHDVSWWIFRINAEGLHRGIIAAAKRSAMLCFSLAWLWSTSFPETYRAVGWCDGQNRYILLFLRNIQILWRELLQFRQSINTRSPNIPYLHPLQVAKLRLMIQAVIIRLFDTVARITYSAETHHRDSKSIRAMVLKDICVKYDPAMNYVLSQIDCTFGIGEFIYLAGLNGAGKTTLLRLMAGYIPRIEGQYDGTLLYGDENADRLSLRDYAKVVKYVPSEAFLSIIGLTVGQEILTVANSEKDARFWLGKMGIDQLWARETVKLSGGEQVRLVLACALAGKTSFILLDSPLEQLDASGRNQFLCALRELALVNGITVIVADPNFEAFKTFISRFILLENGRITEDIPPPRVTHDHLHRAGVVKPVVRSVGRPKSGIPLAELRDVRLVLDGVQILNGLGFEIYNGEFVAIIGENGSGKTTAMLALAGLYKIRKGMRSAASPVHYAFQDPFLQMLGATCEEELTIGPTFYRWPPEKSKKFVLTQLDWAGVKANEQPVQLHPGKARLLSIAAMNFDDGVLILDEPTIGLDQNGLSRIVDLIASRISSGGAVIAITHDVGLAQCASRIVEMKNGSITDERQAHVAVPQEGSEVLAPRSTRFDKA